MPFCYELHSTQTSQLLCLFVAHAVIKSGQIVLGGSPFVFVFVFVENVGRLCHGNIVVLAVWEDICINFASCIAKIYSLPYTVNASR